MGRRAGRGSAPKCGAEQNCGTTHMGWLLLPGASFSCENILNRKDSPSVRSMMQINGSSISPILQHDWRVETPVDPN